MSGPSNNRGNGSVAPPPIGIGKLLRRSHLAFSSIFRDRLKAHGATFSEFVHLERLWHEDGLNQTELSRRVGVETASSTLVLDALEKRGFIRRERDPRDRHNVRVFLKPAGAKLETKLLACAADANAIARQGLSAEDIVTFFGLMETIVGNLEARKTDAERLSGKETRARRAKPVKSTEATEPVRKRVRTL